MTVVKECMLRRHVIVGSPRHITKAGKVQILLKSTKICFTTSTSQNYSQQSIGALCFVEICKGGSGSSLIKNKEYSSKQ